MKPIYQQDNHKSSGFLAQHFICLLKLSMLDLAKKSFKCNTNENIGFFFKFLNAPKTRSNYFTEFKKIICFRVITY